MKRLLEILQASSDYLAGKGVDQPRLTAEQLMSHVLRCPRLQLYLRFEVPLDEPQLVPLRAAIKRLGAGDPLQYVLGDTEFMGRRFKVDARALIPRPETEELVDRVLNCTPLWANPIPVVADVGTGSGCIVISLAVARPSARYLAIDASPAAIELARENAALNKTVSIEFRVGDLLAGVAAGSLDGVIANLPYIPTHDCATLPRHIREHEPLSALDGGEDGLFLIRRLISGAWDGLKPGGHLFLEIGFDQSGRVVKCLNSLGYDGVTVHQDLGGRDRMVEARKPG
jgi:release factor glutamine methyltransferase